MIDGLRVNVWIAVLGLTFAAGCASSTSSTVKTGCEVSPEERQAARKAVADSEGELSLFHFIAQWNENNTKTVNQFWRAGIAENSKILHTGILRVSKRKKEFFKQAITCGADVNARDDEGRTPLYAVARWDGSPELARVLIDNGANINATDNKGKTPFTRQLPREIPT